MAQRFVEALSKVRMAELQIKSWQEYGAPEREPSRMPQLPAAELVHLRFFGGLSLAEAANIIGMTPRTADRLWAYARAWLHQEIQGDSKGDKS